jgi:hypothetical protein
MHDAGKLQVYKAFVETLEVISEQQISSYQVARRKEFHT